MRCAASRNALAGRAHCQRAGATRAVPSGADLPRGCAVADRAQAVLPPLAHAAAPCLVQRVRAPLAAAAATNAVLTRVQLSQGALHPAVARRVQCCCGAPACSTCGGLPDSPRVRSGRRSAWPQSYAAITCLLACSNAGRALAGTRCSRSLQVPAPCSEKSVCLGEPAVDAFVCAPGACCAQGDIASHGLGTADGGGPRCSAAAELTAPGCSSLRDCRCCRLEVPYTRD